MALCKATPEILNAVEKIKKCNNEQGECQAGDVTNIMKESNAFYLDRGAFRRVFEYKKGRRWKLGKFKDLIVEDTLLPNHNCIVKIPHGKSGRKAVIDEHAEWISIPRKVRKLYAPVEDFDEDGNFLTQPRFLVNELKKDVRENIINILREQLSKNKIRCRDLHDENVGMSKKGEYKIVDYNFGSCSIGDDE